NTGAARSRARPRAGALRLFVQFFGIRRRRASADERKCAATTGLPVWGIEARGGTALLSVLRQLRRADGLVALLHRLRTAAAPGYEFSPLPPRRVMRRTDPGVWRRRADARFHVCDGCRRSQPLGGRTWSARTRLQHRWGGARLREPRARPHR